MKTITNEPTAANKGRWLDTTLADLDDISDRFEHPEEILDHAAWVVGDAIRHPWCLPHRTCTLSLRYRVMRRDLPYALLPCNIPGRVILLNRNYKPCGSTLSNLTWNVVYENCTRHHLDLAQLPAGIRSTAEGRGYFLFNDGNPPWSSVTNARQYLLRLIDLGAKRPTQS